MTRVIFMGTPDYAASILETLITTDNIEVVTVYTQPDKPVGRKAIMSAPIVKVVAEKANIPVIQPHRLRDEAVVKEVLATPCDMIIVAAYGQVLPKAILDHAPCINLHASILPQYRGASPIQQSLLNNDTQSGVSAMWMDVGLDTGAIIKIETIAIAQDEMVESLYSRLTETAVNLTLDVIHNWDRRTATAQNDAEATHCKKILKSDGLIDFSDAREIYNRYRAYTPWPGLFSESGLKIKEMKLEEETSLGEAGKIIHMDKEGIVVQCSCGSLRITRVQAPSKQETSVVDYLNGKRIGCGHSLV
ncbi:MAG: methionyl-tRNA formyltransferase [Sulfuricurvum sp.]|uniref:methionyl-tRNA formyltransferase n=1 Tax=Sulfuricurvum sp. TaxID=2025608 RepID=UPI0025EE2372|nr:methionyl-tRNA formyltransferase [Sulfuricurvum sp.]MBV5321803.1 methionyl-tRNA formyltransferase [Sulfuricurvum sp.]